MKQITLQVEIDGKPEIETVPNSARSVFYSSLLAFIKEKKGETNAI